LDVFFLGAIA